MMNSKRFVAFTLLSIFSILISHSLRAETVGVVAGEFRVNESGGATYNIPIALPAGRAEVQPQVSLSYSSQNMAEGLIGVGWNISAGSAITRCPPNPVEDAAIGPITFTQVDKFCLDGQRLKLRSGGNSTIERLYRLDSDNFALITAHGNTNPSDYNPLYFSVKTKSGETHYYGNASQIHSNFGGADAFIEPSGYPANQVASSWLLKAIVDVKGNFIRYSYNENNAKGTATLDKIAYGGTLNSDAPFAEVSFEYTSTQKGFGGYYFGTPVLNDQRLQTITSKVDGVVYRQYSLEYESSTLMEERTLLKSIEECAPLSAGNSSLTCKPKTTFDWERDTLASSGTVRVCETEPGFSFCWDQPTTTNFSAFDANYRFTTGVSTAHTRVFDIDGDGRDDLIYEQDWRWRVRLASSPYSNIELTNYGVGSGKKEYVLVMDANADGVRDLLVAQGEGQLWYRVSYADGIKRVASLGWNVKAVGFQGETQIADVNGDGREDIVFRQGANIKAYLQPIPGQAWIEDTLYTFPNDISSGGFDGNVTSQTGNMQSASAIDLNGDGRSDLIMKVTTRTGYCGGPIPGGPPIFRRGANADEVFQSSVLPSPIPDLIRTADENPGMEDLEANFRQIGNTLDKDGQYTNSFNEWDCRDMGRQWITTTQTHYKSFIATGSISNPSLEERGNIGSGSIKQLRVADLNGDGLTDITYVVGTTWYYRLSTGTGFTAPDTMGLIANDNHNYLTQFVDLNRDGRADVLLATSRTNMSVRFSRPNLSNSTKIYFEHRGNFGLGNNAQVAFGDVNGDSKLDLMRQDGGNWQVFTKRSFRPDFVIKRITNGFGVATDINYLPMTNASVYVEKPLHGSLDARTISPRSGGFLVSSVYSDITDNSQLGVRYAYGGMRLDTQGRGSLGFQLLRTTDVQTGIVTDTRYYQNVSGNNYLLVGMPISTIQKRGNVIISEATNTPQVRGTYSGGLFPYIAQSVEKSYWVDNNAITSRLASTTTTTNVYDAFGNLTNNTIVQSGHNSQANEAITTTTSSVYFAGAEQQRLGRLQRTTVTKTRGGLSNTRVSEFTYRSSDNMLATSTQFGDQVAGNYTNTSQISYVNGGLKTLYDYDQYGNTTRVCSTSNLSYVLPSNGTIPDGKTTPNVRCSKTEYFPGGRYVSKNINSFGEAVSYNIVTSLSNQRGIINYVDQSDDNNIRTRTFYDGFGEVTSIDHADSRFTNITRNYTTSYGAHYYETLNETAKPIINTYYDRFGREVAKRQRYREEGNDYNWLTVLTTYDSQGRPSTVSEPNSASVTRSEYDILGRVIRATYPHGAQDTIEFIDKTVVTTNDNNQRRTETKNGLGETSRTTDNNGNYIDFVYNEYGQLITTTTSFAPAQVIQTQYDSWGRKVSVSDPNKGRWATNVNVQSKLKGGTRYEYNVFGEVIYQIDANNQAYLFDYDGLGRLKKRYNASEGTTCYAYGSTQHRGIRASGKLRHKALYSGNLSCSDSVITSNQKEVVEYMYDSLGRLQSTATAINGNTFAVHSQTYNAFSQIDVATLPSGHRALTLKHNYDSIGALRNIVHNQTGRTIWSVDEFTGRGQVKEIKLGNGMTVNYGYDVNGHNTSVSSKYGGTVFHSANINIDNIGNVYSKTSQYRNTNGTYQTFTEGFSYDTLNRLRTRTISIAAQGTPLPADFRQTHSYDYDQAGNIQYKSDKGYYKYSSTVANQLDGIYSHVSRATQYRILGFTYDNVGNVKSDGQRTFDYTAFDKPSRIRKGSNIIDMTYGIDRQLLSKRHDRMEGTSRVITQHQYAGNYERITKSTGNGVTEHKYHLLGGMVVITQRSNGNEETHYIHKDTQGSVTLITDQNRNIVSQSLYDPFGEQMQVFQGGLLNNITYQIPTEAGYTGHHQLNSVGITHMGGRIYDASIGRFMQADPFIQAPMNSQNYNRYSYVLNNPMSYTDPSGYFFKKIFRNIIRASVKIFGAELTNFVGNILFYKLGGPLGSAYWTYNFSRAMGVSSSGALRGAFTSAATAFVFQQVGKGFQGPEGSWNVQGGAAHIAAHAITGGIVAELQGGKFGHGFISAGLTKGAQVSGIVNMDNMYIGSLQSAIIGGTISAITGGKFGNGAQTATFQYLYNAWSSKAIRKAQEGIRILNKKLAGKVHDKTGIPFDKDGFPIFDDVAEATEEIAMTGVRSVDDALANAQAGFDKTPDGFTWHHVQDGKTMQLVPTDIHNAVAHTGGVAVIRWLNKFSAGLSVAAPYISAFDPTYYGEQMAIQGCNNGNISMCGAATMFGAEAQPKFY